MPVNLNGIDLTGGAAVGSARKASAAQPTSADSNDSTPQQGEVSITSTASLLANVQQSLSALPAIDQNRVDAISKALAAGTYRVDPDKIAGGLIQSERDLAQLG